jgi:hypothetical protein
LLTHRHTLSAREARARRPAPLLRRVSPAGWLFAALAVGWTALELRVLLEPGALDPMDWANDAQLVVRTLGDVALIALPAALAFGYPAVARRNRPLWRGAVLLALAQLAEPVVRFVQGWLFEQTMDLFDNPFDPSTPVGAVLVRLRIAVALLAIAGTWSVSDGLAAAGARPSRAAIVAMGLAGAALVPITIWPSALDTGFGTNLTTVLFVVSAALNLASFALWFVVAARLVVGWAARLAPARAWLVGAMAGAVLVGSRFLTTLTLVAGPRFDAPPLVYGLLVATPWVLLALAFALGLGRPRFRRRQFEVWAGGAEHP